MTQPPRIAAVPEPLTGKAAEMMAKLLPPGMHAPELFRTVLRNEGLFEFQVQSRTIGPTGLMDRHTLAPRLREIIILRTCVVTQCDYEFNLHVQTISERMGLQMSEIEDLRQPVFKATTWSTAEHAIVALIDESVAHCLIKDETYEHASQHFSDEDLIEIVQLAGMYRGVAMLVGLIRPELDQYKPGKPYLTAV